jgi:uncharacterized protein (TIGR03437 family)
MKNFAYYILALSSPVWAQAPTINTSPTREFGQPQLSPTLYTAAPNYVEGRELYAPGSVALDTVSSPHVLYVADMANNRVLAWQNPESLATCGTGNPKCGFASLVIGQRDLFSTLPQGPASSGSQLSSGLSFPTAVAVDSSGNLYVADVGNNRVLRFPQPFKQQAATQPGTLFTVDLVIGQTSATSGGSPNQGLSTPNAGTLFLSTSSSRLRTGLAIDPTTQNLWVTDPGNNRVLGFLKSSLTANSGQAVQATMVLGQSGFTTGSAPTAYPQSSICPTGDSQCNQQTLASATVQPSSLAFDQQGRLYVADVFSRVLYFGVPSSFVPATRILGVNQRQTTASPTYLPYPNQYTLGIPSSTNASPQGLFTFGNNLFVCDTYANRVVEYDVPQNWPQATTLNPSPPNLLTQNLLGQTAVSGNNPVLISSANQDLPQPTAQTLDLPFAGVVSSVDSSMWIADAGNNRVLKFTPQNGTYQTASVVVGQLDFKYNAPNLIEGKEVYFPYPLSIHQYNVGPSAMVIDRNSNPPHLYISDYGNNRVLGFKDYRTVTQASTADLVIGQPDLFSSIVDYGGQVTAPGPTGLSGPVGLAVDSNGNLWVADSGNGRVLRFPAPFSVAAGQAQTASVVLGAAGVYTPPTGNASQNTMGTPWGIALFSEGSIAVSDAAFNRVLVFLRPAGGDFSNGQLASTVLGQQLYSTTTASLGTGTTSASLAGMNTPTHIATDTDDTLYVCDTGNNRLLIFPNPKSAVPGASSVSPVTGLSNPQGVIVNSYFQNGTAAGTGEIWVADTGNSRVLRLSAYGNLGVNLGVPEITAVIPAPAPLALTLDPGSNVIVGDAYNRVTFFYAQLTYENAANFNQNGLAPGMIGLLYRLSPNNNAGFNQITPQDYTPGSAQTLPWPAVLNDIQVLFTNPLTGASVAAPLYRLDAGGYIAFQVPSSLPTSGVANIVVMHQSTGAIVAASSLNSSDPNAILMTQANPGFLTSGSAGTGQVLAFNAADGTVNGPTNPVAVGQSIAFCLTGVGPVPGAPPDGSAPPGAVYAPGSLVVATNPGGDISSSVSYSGLGCGFPGLWQINLLVPTKIPAVNSTVQIVIQYDGLYQSNVGFGNATLLTTFSVK